MVGGATFGIGALHAQSVPFLRHCCVRKLSLQPKLAEVPEASEEPVYIPHGPLFSSFAETI